MSKEESFPITSSDFLKTVDRVTFLTRVHHQRKGTDARSYDFSGWYMCQESEQTYERDFTLKAHQRLKLDCMWLRGIAGQIVIENRTDLVQKINPSIEETEETKKKILRVYIGDQPKGMIVRPRHTPLIVELDPTDHLELCSEYDIDVRVFILPR